jgi:hypothetical protein
MSGHKMIDPVDSMKRLIPLYGLMDKKLVCVQGVRSPASLRCLRVWSFQ